MRNFLGDMDVYARRRLVAASVAVLATVVLIVVITSSSGGSADSRPKAAKVVEQPDPPLVAKVSSKHVKRPNKRQGQGAFMTIERRTVEMRDVPDPGRKVALTFDDGPAELTPKFLDKLARLKAPASFFVLGVQVGEHPELVRRADAMGMTIANHSYSHSNMMLQTPTEQRTELVRTSGLIEEAIGRRPYFFRFPGHDWDYSAVRQMAQQGLVGTRFSIDTQDWRPVGTKEIIARALTAKPGDVIQMHDGGPAREQTLRAVGPIVKGLRRRGFELVTLDQLYRPVARQRSSSSAG